MMTFAGVIFLLTVEVGFGEVFPLNMTENSVDDQYEGCKANMSRKYVDMELDEKFKSAWKRGEDWWQKHTMEVRKHSFSKHNLDKDNYISMYVYTDKDTRIYKMFNDASRSGKKDYIQRTYQWYSLHFFLTRAVQVLKNSEREEGVLCRRTYRGMNSTFEKNVKGKEIRLGSFTSSSLNRDIAEDFGKVSCFEINTCHGADIIQYSAYPKEEEVLIPPYETFKVLDVKSDWCDTVYVLNSTGVKNYLNCGEISGSEAAAGIDHYYQTLWVVCVCVMMLIQS